MVCFRTCCCGCTLGQGTVITAILTLLEGISGLIFGVGLYVNWSVLQEFIEKALIPLETIRIIGIVFIVIGAVIVLSSILVFCGVSSKTRCLVLPWLLVYGIGLVGGIIGLIYHCITVGVDFRLIGSTIGQTLIMGYFYLVVLSWHQSNSGEPDYDDNYEMNGRYMNGQYMGRSADSAWGEPPPNYRMGYR